MKPGFTASFGIRVALLLAGGLVGYGCASGAAAPDPLIAVEVIEDVLPVYVNGGQRDLVRNPTDEDEFPPMRVLLSRRRYWQQDGHMDVVVRLVAPEGVDIEATSLRVELRADGESVSRFVIDPVPGDQFIFYPRLPEALLGEASISLHWKHGERLLEADEQPFRVERFAAPAERAGRVNLRLPNPARVHLANLPVTVGVPFGRGVLDDHAHLRLVDEDGREVPVQTREIARWSKFGTIKWVRCDFTVDLAGEARELFLEYGPAVARKRQRAIDVQGGEGGGLPTIDAGRLRLDDGLWYDAAGDGGHVRVLDAAALSGGFVEHENGRLYRMPDGGQYAVEEHGPEKLVLRREGWYREATGDGQFCRYITRYVLHRDAPLVRVFHTWIFTGDGNHERIRNMGWRFDLADALRPEGFLTSFGEAGTWEPADFLLQWDFDHFDLVRGRETAEHAGGRAPGAAAAGGPDVRLYFGAKDFWQNYPSELEFADGALWFHNWPRHNRPAGYTFEGELLTSPGEPAPASAARHAQVEPGRLTPSEWRLNAVQVRFAHEGELLDFRLPQAYGESVIANDAMRVGRASSHHWEPGDVETVNAQGISRTEEMWIYLASADADEANARRVLEGLNDETLRAVVDPVWMAASGAFFEIHHQDWENYPEEERAYELLALSIPNVAERLGVYGMWIYGDLPAWHPQLPQRQPALYRAFRKGHHGWPYSWIPYARSGDPRLLKIAEASTRQMVDANYCHYYDDHVQSVIGEGRARRIGRWNRSALPWAGYRNPVSRNYTSATDFLWKAYYLASDFRARDNALSFGEQTRVEEDLPGRGPISPVGERQSISVLKSYVDMYEATFDPWFLVAAHAIGEGHLGKRYYGYGELRYPRLWETADGDFLRFTGDPAFEEHYLWFARLAADERDRQLFNTRTPQFPPKAQAWAITGDPFYLRRIAGGLDWGTALPRVGDDPDYLQGYPAVMGQFTGFSLHAPYYLKWFPMALWALARAGETPEPIYRTMLIAGRDERFQEFVVRKHDDQPVPMHLRANRAAGTLAYALRGPDGRTLAQGHWTRPREEGQPDSYLIEIPADSPAGDYRLRVDLDMNARPRDRLVQMPVTPADHPEVIQLDPGEAMFDIAETFGPLWFMVPEGLQTFRVRFGQADLHASIWSPDGKRIFDMSRDRRGTDPRFAYEVEIEVAPGQDGRLWRIMMPGATRFEMDPAIPPVYAANPSRWFLPDALSDASAGE